MSRVDEPGPTHEQLLRLREFVARARQQRSALPLPELVTLAQELEIASGVTIDFSASETLGAPMVVLRPTDSPRTTTVDPLAALSPRELEVAEQLSLGLRNREIASRLGISIATVKDHVHHILDKTGLPGRAAVAIAYITRPEA
ncbi:MAG: helix-turn-helix transcriptional regulator [Deltaproteobacteria bacterium]|nr:helix-turn-helix transcriptional regulator [Deltaproteobacteria bacterium]